MPDADQLTRDVHRYQGLLHAAISALNSERDAMRRLEQATVANAGAVAAVRGVLGWLEQEADKGLGMPLSEIIERLRGALNAPF